MSRETLIHIMQTERYVVDVDSRKNRIYMRILNAGRGLPEPSHFLEELHEVKHHLSDGFTILLELCSREVEPQQAPPLVKDAMDLLFEGGVRKIANLFQESSIQQGFSNLELECIQQSVQHRGFISREAAEAWLDMHEGVSCE